MDGSWGKAVSAVIITNSLPHSFPPPPFFFWNDWQSKLFWVRVEQIARTRKGFFALYALHNTSGSVCHAALQPLLGRTTLPCQCCQDANHAGWYFKRREVATVGVIRQQQFWAHLHRSRPTDSSCGKLHSVQARSHRGKCSALTVEVTNCNLQSILTRNADEKPSWNGIHTGLSE